MNTRYPPFNTLQGKTQLHNNGQRGKNARLIGLGGGGGIVTFRNQDESLYRTESIHRKIVATVKGTEMTAKIQTQGEMYMPPCSLILTNSVEKKFYRKESAIPSPFSPFQGQPMERTATMVVGSMSITATLENNALQARQGGGFLPEKSGPVLSKLLSPHVMLVPIVSRLESPQSSVDRLTARPRPVSSSAEGQGGGGCLPVALSTEPALVTPLPVPGKRELLSHIQQTLRSWNYRNNHLWQRSSFYSVFGSSSQCDR
ncbi:unnamed protein product [Aspergillus oryzae]|uniref:Unnamed protein product n=1 Tax=Aspergillus oryzae TaxID=5062 RepID=A0AAN4YGH3_ASPOZ|nr:unnamed protein product [Aspergillus oryzae]GMF89600.1 unnamed protein product [Aspergillus oryzae]GMG30120.1 unnamed protein product [Aspergillus oryzae]